MAFHTADYRFRTVKASRNIEGRTKKNGRLISDRFLVERASYGFLTVTFVPVLLPSTS